MPYEPDPQPTEGTFELVTGRLEDVCVVDTAGDVTLNVIVLLYDGDWTVDESVLDPNAEKLLEDTAVLDIARLLLVAKLDPDADDGELVAEMGLVGELDADELDELSVIVDSREEEEEVPVETIKLEDELKLVVIVKLVAELLRLRDEVVCKLDESELDRPVEELLVPWRVDVCEMDELEEDIVVTGLIKRPELDDTACDEVDTTDD